MTMLAGISSAAKRWTESALKSWNQFHSEMRAMDMPRSGDLILLDRKGWQFARVSSLVNCDEPGKLFEIMADDGRQYTIKPAEKSAARWRLVRLL